jgi:hypothetical protein
MLHDAFIDGGAHVGVGGPTIESVVCTAQLLSALSQPSLLPLVGQGQGQARGGRGVRGGADTEAQHAPGAL